MLRITKRVNNYQLIGDFHASQLNKVPLQYQLNER